MSNLTCDTGIAPISLEEINARAELQSRVDQKYLVPLWVAQELPLWLPQGSRVLEIGGLRRFGYQSTYFDTPQLDLYRWAAHGRRNRFKLRTRAYCESGTAFLEVKTKGQRGATVKNRIGHDIEKMDCLSAADRTYVEGLLAGTRISTEPLERLLPALHTGYQRTTFLLPGRTDSGQPDARITADTGLLWETTGPHQEASGELYRPDLAIIETKTASQSSFANRLFLSRGIRPVRISKYATGMAALRADLPANKWHRTRAQLLAMEVN